MEEIRTLKGVRKDKWIKFKTLAARRNVPLGVLFESMLEDYSRRADIVWKKILKKEKVISDEEAKDLLSITKKIRKEKGFRV